MQLDSLCLPRWSNTVILGEQRAVTAFIKDLQATKKVTDALSQNNYPVKFANGVGDL